MSDFRQHREIADQRVRNGLNVRDLVLSMRDAMITEGASFFRVTVLEAEYIPVHADQIGRPGYVNVVVLDGWREQPDDQGPAPTLADIFPESAR